MLFIINRPTNKVGYLPPQGDSLFGISHIIETKTLKGPEKVGRNEICPCGCGKKAKRCSRKIRHFMDKCLSNFVWWMIAPFCYIAYLSGRRSKKK